MPGTRSSARLLAKRQRSPSNSDDKSADTVVSEKKENTPTKKTRIEEADYQSRTPEVVVRAKRRLAFGQKAFKIIGREAELAHLSDFIGDKVKNETPASLYVSGLPGTGKTMCVKRVIEDLKGDLKYRLIWINCMTLESIGDFYERIAESINFKRKTPLKRTPNKISEKDLEAYFTLGKSMSVLCLDEIDQLQGSFSSMLSRVFEWPMLFRSNVILIGISNSFDLTDRCLKKLRLKGDVKPELLHFRPYKTEEIVAIVKDRLSEYMDIMHPQALELCARKCAAVAGDVRKALETCKVAIECAAFHRPSNALQPGASTEVFCNSSEVLAALQDVYAPTKRNSHYVVLPLQQKLIFAAAFSLSTSGMKQFSVEKLFDEYKRICSVAHVPSVDSSETRNLCDLLESSSLLRRSAVGRNSKYILNGNEKHAREVIDDDRLLSALLASKV